MSDPLEFRKIIKKAAKSVANHWENVNADDLEQDMWLRLLESPGALAGLDDPTSVQTSRYMFKIAQQVAKVDVTKQREFNGDLVYNKTQVRKMLENGALLEAGTPNASSWAFDESSPGSYLPSDTVGVTASAKHDITMAMRDMKESNDRLFDLLVQRYLLTLVPFESGSTDQVATSRAVAALTEKMNFNRRRDMATHEGPGSRKAISNAKARAKSGNDYDEPTSDAWNAGNGFGRF